MPLPLQFRVFSLFFLVSTLTFGQQTIGLFSNTADAFDGYTLFAPMSATKTYLIDNCGEKVHSWDSNYEPALSTYLLENGNLLRTGSLDNPDFNVGGSGGIVEMFDWNGNLIWEHTISSDSECHHHDVEFLPNGNVLIIAWDLRTTAEAEQAGRSQMGSSVWSEKIIEIKPDYGQGEGGTIVWEWYAWDHLVQDYDSAKDNYGVVADAPELIDINYTLTNLNNEDWLHFNGIDYNEELDQIVVSSRSNSEFWIIDHSTTTAEAAAHTGGNSGNGGDLLYRWGNPEAYDQGTSSDRRLYLQHDARWVPAGYPNEGEIMVYNNRAGDAVGSNYSEVSRITTPVTGNGDYIYSGGAHDPSSFSWTYQASTPTDFYSAAISGAHPLPNGNTLICEGAKGRFFEVDNSGSTVWEYLNPVGSGVVLTQGDVASGTNTFRCTRYAPDYAGLSSQDLTPQGYIESGSTFSCDLFSTASLATNQLPDALEIYPNPASTKFTISAPQKIEEIRIYSANGTMILGERLTELTSSVEISELPSGLYLVRTNLIDGKVFTNKLVVE